MSPEFACAKAPKPRLNHTPPPRAGTRFPGDIHPIPELAKPWTLEQSSRDSEIALPKVKYRPFFAKYSSFTHRVKLKQSGLQLEGPGQLVVSAGLRRQSGLQVQDCRFRERPVVDAVFTG
jgi:hypothetical protein